MIKRTFVVAVATICGAALVQIQSAQAMAQAHPTIGATAPSVGRPHHKHKAPMLQLRDAAQEFRDAVRTVAAQSVGPQKHEALKAANKALMDIQNAIAIRHLQNTSQKLQKAIQEIQSELPGAKRDEAINEADDAILDAQQVITDLQTKSQS